MKPLKKALQKNVRLNTDNLTNERIETLLLTNQAFYWDNNDISYNYDNFNKFHHELNLYLSEVKDLKVVCEDGYYKTVAITNLHYTYEVIL